MNDPDGIERRLQRAAPREPGAALDRRIRAAIAQGAGEGAGRRAPSPRSWGLAAAAGLLLGVAAAVWIPGSAPSGLALADGGRVEAGPGARLRVLGPRDVDLSSGEAFFRVARRGDGARFIVRTPRGPVEVLGTSFWVTVKEESVDRKAKAGAIVSVAVVSGVVAFHYLGGDPAERARRGRLEAGDIGTSWQGGYERRKGELAAGTAAAGAAIAEAGAERAGLAAIQREIEREKAVAERLARQIEGAERLSSAEKPLEGKEEGAEGEMDLSFGSLTGRAAIGPDDAAELLALDASRAASLARMHAETMAKLRASADERTSVRREGSETIITIGTYPDEARRILEEWGHQVGALLSPGEMERYRKFGMESGLFGEPGTRERRFVLIGSGDALKAQERGGNEIGEWWMDTDPKAVLERFKRQLGGGR